MADLKSLWDSSTVFVIVFSHSICGLLILGVVRVLLLTLGIFMLCYKMLDLI